MTPAKKVSCPQCKRLQGDDGRRSSCRYCGLQPIPSYSYPKSSVFHPDYEGVEKAVGKTITAAYAQIKERRARR